MYNIKAWIAQNKKISIAIGVILGLIIALVLLLLLDTNGTVVPKVKPTIVTSKNEVISNDIQLSDISDIEILDELLYIIDNLNSGYYCINDRHFVVLKTSGDSSFDIEYTVNTSLDGLLSIEYRVSDTSDNEFKQRYKIIEVATSDVKVNKATSTTYTDGYLDVIVYNSNGQNIIYDIINKRQVSATGKTVLLDGIYTITMVDGVITDGQQLDKIEISNCQILSKVNQTNNTYIVELSPGYNLEMKFEDRNFSLNTHYNFVISCNRGEFNCIGTWGNGLSEFNSEYREGDIVYEEVE